MEPKIDFLGADGKGQGEFAAHVLGSGRLDPGAMRPYVAPEDGQGYVTVYTGGDPDKPENYQVRPQANATLRRDEWKQLDSAVLKIADTRLVGIQDIVSRGLTFNLNGMGTTVLEYHTMSNAMSAEMTMDAVSRGQGDRPTFATVYMPLPIIHVDYEINARVLEVSRRLGNPLDTSSAERAARKVAEKLEDMLFTNETYAYGGGTIYSYVNEPNRNLVTLGTNWDASSKTGKQITDDVRSMKQSSIAAKHYGPWMLYIPTDYETVMDDDYSTAKGSNTIRERILKIAGVNDVKVVDTLADDTVLLIQMTSDVVRLVRGMGIQNVEWTTEGKMVTKYKVMTIQVPQIRSDVDNNSGIVHLS